MPMIEGSKPFQRRTRAVERRVEFIIAGVQKGGTTALHEYLARDKTFSLSSVKETHFFDDDTHDWKNPNYDHYHAYFDWTAAGIRGETTPIYIYWPECLERIATYNPAMKIIVLLRDPVERAWSQWRMEKSRGGEVRPFSWCIRQGRQRLFENIPWGHHRVYSYVERGYYGAQVELLLSTINPTQVMFLKAEDLRTDPNLALYNIYSFLGAKFRTQVPLREVHVGVEMGDLAKDDIAHLRALYAADDRRLRKLTGISFDRSHF